MATEPPWPPTTDAQLPKSVVTHWGGGHRASTQAPKTVGGAVVWVRQGVLSPRGSTTTPTTIGWLGSSLAWRRPTPLQQGPPCSTGECVDEHTADGGAVSATGERECGRRLGGGQAAPPRVPHHLSSSYEPCSLWIPCAGSWPSMARVLAGGWSPKAIPLGL